MIDEHNLVTVGRFDGDAYESSQAAEQTLNAAIPARRNRQELRGVSGDL